MYSGTKLFLLAALLGLVLASAGCHGDVSVLKERGVARVGVNDIYLPTLEREVLRSKEIVRNTKRNDFYGFSPLRTLKIYRGDLAYLVQETALVLPAGSLDRNQIIAEADKRAKDTADDIYNRLVNGGDWDKLNEQYSVFEGKANGGKLPAFSKGYTGVPEDFYNLKRGEYFKPFKWSWGYSVIRFDGITTGDNGEEQYNASMILIAPDEKAVKNEEIEQILHEKTVTILDPTIQAFDYYLKGRYDDAMKLLEDKSPAPTWPDLGYYVLSLCADAKKDAQGRLDYLMKAIDASKRAGGLLPWYEFEVGEILAAKDDPSAIDYYHKAFDHTANDYDLVTLLIARFEKLGDADYTTKAKTRLSEMDSIIKRQSGRGISKDQVVTGEVHAEKPSFDDL